VTEDAARAFAERLTSDEAFAGRLASAPTTEDRQRMAEEAGYHVTSDDLATIKSTLRIEEISDEELENIAGGGVYLDPWDYEHFVEVLLVVPGAGAAALI
jgi:predicted ribosomally synthesized peptide with nif11-like leader